MQNNALNLIVWNTTLLCLIHTIRDPMNEVGKDCGEVRLIEQVTGCDATLLRHCFSKLSIISNYTKKLPCRTICCDVWHR